MDDERPPPLPGDPRCPDCGTGNDAYTDVDLKDARPKAGSVSICLYCGAVNVFAVNPLTGHYSLRTPTKKEWRVIQSDDRIRIARVTSARFRAERN